jgi:hypothetical protein
MHEKTRGIVRITKGNIMIGSFKKLKINDLKIQFKTQTK